MQAQRDLIDEIRTLIAETLLVEVESPDADLLHEGVLDSVSMVQLILHLEEHFGLKIELHALELDDLRSVNSIVRLVAARGAVCTSAVGLRTTRYPLEEGGTALP